MNSLYLLFFFSCIFPERKKLKAPMTYHTGTGQVIYGFVSSWAEEPGRLLSMSRTWLSDFIFTFHFHALEKEMATHSSVLDWRIPGMGEPGGLPSMGSHRVGHDWSDLAAAAAPGCIGTRPFAGSKFSSFWEYSQGVSLREALRTYQNPCFAYMP